MRVISLRTGKKISNHFLVIIINATPRPPPHLLKWFCHHICATLIGHIERHRKISDHFNWVTARRKSHSGNESNMTDAAFTQINNSPILLLTSYYINIQFQYAWLVNDWKMHPISEWRIRIHSHTLDYVWCIRKIYIKYAIFRFNCKC